MAMAAHSIDRFDLASVRRDFPILARPMNGRRLAFLDSAASAQKPRAVIDAMAEFQASGYANIHRGVYRLSVEATRAHDAARATVARFLGGQPNEIVFTRNATESINLVAASWGGANLGPGDAVLLSELEHHANIVPWQLLQQRLGFDIRVAAIGDDGLIDTDSVRALLADGKVRLVAVAHMSNALGTIQPVAEIAALARAGGALLLLDGCQAAAHGKVDVAALDCDFYVFSGHKLYGPSGIGVLWGRADILAAMPPYQGGGDMIRRVSFAGSSFLPPPQRFEAGTPAITEAIGLAAAIDYLDGIGWDAIAGHEARLTAEAARRLSAIRGLTLHGAGAPHGAIWSFTLEGAHPHDVGTILDTEGVAVRAGHHCAWPLMDRLGVPATVRASFGIYNGTDDLDQLCQALAKVRELFP